MGADALIAIYHRMILDEAETETGSFFFYRLVQVFSAERQKRCCECCFEQADAATTAPDEDVMAVSRRFMQENKEAYEVLAK